MRRTPPKYVRRTWAFDVETEAWDRFVLGCAVSSDGDEIELPDEAAVRRWYCHVVDPRDEIWTFNGGRFDSLLLVDCLAGMRISGTCAGSALISVRAKGKARVRDAAKIAPFMNLRQFADAFGEEEKTELPESWCLRLGECKRRNCGGYCAISRAMPPDRKRRLSAYCMQDGRALLSGLEGLFSFADSLGLEYRGKNGVRGTLGGWAWATIKEMLGDDLPPGFDPTDWEIYRLEREGYYGGRTGVLRWRSDRGRLWDLRGAYSAAMHEPIPTRLTRRVSPGNREYARGCEGAYRAKVDVPIDGPPLLPYRRDPRLLWPVGRVEGVWMREELDAAVRHGAKVVEISEGFLTTKEPWLRDYVKRIAKARAKELRRGGEAAATRARWIKACGNVPSGKLAQGTEVGHLVMGTNDVPDGSTQLGDGAWIVNANRIPDCARPFAAAGITCQPRILLMDRIADPLARVVYCDTDSTPGEGRIPDDVGPDVGQWTDEGTYEAGEIETEAGERVWVPGFVALAPKVYRIRLADGSVKVRAKGVPGFDAEDFETLEARKTVRKSRGVHGVKTALRKSEGVRAFMARTIERTLIGHPWLCGSRIRTPDGGTIALARRPDGSLYWPGSRLNPEKLLF